MKHKFIKILGFLTLVATNATSQSEDQVPQKLADFRTNTGECSATLKNDLQSKFLDTTGLFQIPRSYTTKEATIYQRRGITPPAGKSLKSLQHVQCLANERDKILVTSIGQNERSCGWVMKNDLAKLEQDNPLLAPCGSITPLKVIDFCNIANNATGLSAQTENLLEGCKLVGVKDTQIETKFITDNTTSRRLNSTSDTALTMKKIPIYATADSNVQFGSVDVFSISKVYGAEPTNNGSLRVLIGNNKGPSGWTDLNNGHIWYSTLTTYFNPNGEKSVYLQKIVNGTSDINNQLLASKPSLQHFMVNEDFVKFPVLFDMRVRDEMKPDFEAPQLEIAFIGKFCDGESGQMCASEDNKYSQALSNLRAADVVFLIDGSKSMSKYFGLVAESLTKFTKTYMGNSNYRFGVAMYGDFKATTKTSIGDPIDYEVLLDLQPNRLGNFSSVENAELLILDVLKDKSEAAHAAVFETAKTFQWTEKSKPHFLIHIADHGDRQRPGKKVFNALADDNIFYIPIAVEGEAVLTESQTFINDSKIFAKNYTTANGNPMAVEAIKSYGNGQSNARENIDNALIEATSGWPDLAGGSSSGDILPMLAPAAKEIFNISAGDDIQVLAATGYIETANVGDPEKNWDYFVSLNEADAADLRDDMEEICDKLGRGDDVKTITKTIFSIVRLLTNDKKSEDELIAIWRERSIPLQTETIIGSGIRSMLLKASNDLDLTPYKKEFCRTSLLLELMQKNFKLKIAEENVDLIWQEEYFVEKDKVKFKWRYTDLNGNTRFFLPLSYLPRPVD